MLDTDTKRRIDTARDILVGKVPDPKSQVEQITIALIYKFMDDMDAESELLGGRRAFFAGGFAKYGWAKLMRSGLGGHETLNLYAEAIATMPQNPGIPALFRDIFKNAFLPYRDPETLRAFLKIIDGFHYDHSERLGDAFEYLLSVLGSQGDAGQFRTPRHIIDFIVELVDPKKTDTLLDPACGTAGFLISAYKHILRANTGPDGHSTLTPDERAQLAKNITGYDISPDMVRLSLVNLYLHGFTAPRIHEYDTLTSLDRWNERADVILANPPFMSPKGGIRPHNRFSIPAKRSEVLFVDYMAEHLTPAGRAGIIVPEGIIFQSQNAYRDLRHLLVEESLVAVVSLPAGVFNPYAGVKTSILLLDKARAKRAAHIAFFKVENDGFGLGAQRRPIEQNDLPDIARAVKEWLNRDPQDTDPERLPEDSPLRQLLENGKAIIVPKEKIAENGDYNLSAERYKENGRQSSTKWPVVRLGEFCGFMTGGTPASSVSEYYEGGTVPWLVSGDIHKREIFECERRITEEGVQNSNARYLPENSVLIALNGQGKTRGTVALLRMRATCNQSLVAITPIDQDRALSEYVFWVLRSMYDDIRALTGDNERSGLSITILKTIPIPLPPLSVQQEIVAEIEGYQKVIDGARAVLDNYRPHIPIHPDWPIVKLGEACLFKIESGGTPRSDVPEYWDGPIAWATLVDLPASDVVTEITGTKRAITERGLAESSAKVLPENSIVVSTRATIGRIAINRIPLATNQGFKNIVIADTARAVPEYIAFALTRLVPTMDAWATGGTFKELSKSKFSELEIPLPPLETQRAIVSEIEAEQSLVNANRELAARMEQKIQATLSRVWGEDPAPEN